LTQREIARAVRRELDQAHRFAHTLRVARLAGSLARAHGADAAAAVTSGLLHDVARLWSADDLLRECVRRGMALDEFELANPIVLHAPLGAEIARESYGVRDERVLDAIRLHTLGAPAMAPLAQIVYLADSLEPGRDFPERAAQHRLALADLNAATLAVLTTTAEYQYRRGYAIAPRTVAAIEWYAQAMAAEQTGGPIDGTTEERALCGI
jgi:predicted HD superfamily hydrolase involved in NAD metabolism